MAEQPAIFKFLSNTVGGRVGGVFGAVAKNQMVSTSEEITTTVV